MEDRQGATERVGVAADLVERDQAVVLIERGVLGAFGHDGPGGLLETSDEPEPVLERMPVSLVAEQHCVAHEVEDGWIRARVAALCFGDGLFDRDPVLVGCPPCPGVDIRPVDAERSDDFANGERQAVEREVAMAPVAVGDVFEQVTELVDVAGERDEHDHLLC